MDWYLLPWKKFADFGGRARRMEYWIFWLVNGLIGSVLGLVSMQLFGIVILSALFSMAVLIPRLAVTVRRLHDIGRSGWWILISLVPFVGGIILLVLCLGDSQAGTNQWGPNPKEAVGSQGGHGGGFCQYCGAKLPSGAAFCQKCGTKTT